MCSNVVVSLAIVLAFCCLSLVTCMDDVRMNRLNVLSSILHDSELEFTSTNNTSNMSSFPRETDVNLLKWIDEQDKARNGSGRSKLSCYYTISKTPPVDKFNVSLCTHLVVIGGTGISSGLLNVSVVTRQRTKSLRERIDKLPVTARPKLMLSITENSRLFSNVSATSSGRKAFAANAVSVLRALRVDGLDFDWEFPVFTSKVPEDRKNFPLLLREMRLAMLTTGNSPGGGLSPSIISAAVGAPKAIISVSYDIPALSSYVDFINLMTYDFHFYRSDNPIFWFTGHNSPLYHRKWEELYFATENIAYSSAAWVSGGTPPHKLLVGLPTYGHTYHLLFSWWHTVWALSDDSGFGKGWCTYKQICDRLRSGAMTRVFDAESRVPYAYSTGGEKQWWSYDDVQSTSDKCRYIKSRAYGGAMIYDVNADDWDGKSCGQGPYPLITTANRLLISQ